MLTINIHKTVGLAESNGGGGMYLFIIDHVYLGVGSSKCVQFTCKLCSMCDEKILLEHFINLKETIVINILVHNSILALSAPSWN